MAKFNTKEEYEKWLKAEEWYQTIELPSGLKTLGKVPTNLRRGVFEAMDFKGKRVLDIGCNSGQYSLFAKKMGAREVLGIDIDSKRIHQAQVLSENEGLDIKFEERGILETHDLGKFDIVLCIAVLTEIQDFFGAVEKLKNLIGERALVELDLAKPLFYLSRSKNWLRGTGAVSRQKALAELRQTHGGKWIFSPTLEILQNTFGPEFKLKRLSGGLRYDLIEVVRLS